MKLVPNTLKEVKLLNPSWKPRTSFYFFILDCTGKCPILGGGKKNYLAIITGRKIWNLPNLDKLRFALILKLCLGYRGTEAQWHWWYTCRSMIKPYKYYYCINGRKQSKRYLNAMQWQRKLRSWSKLRYMQGACGYTMAIYMYVAYKNNCVICHILVHTR